MAAAATALFAAASSAWAQSAPEKAAESLSRAIGLACLAALFGGIGWIIAYVLNGMREDRTRRLQMMLDRTDTQIREFYAPLVALTEQLNSMANVCDQTRAKSPNGGASLVGPMFDRFFLPIHEEIVHILKTKIHLREGDDVVSFNDYFEHFAAQKVLWELRAAALQVGDMREPPFPKAFFWDLRKDYQAVSSRYEAGLLELRHRKIPLIHR